MQTIMHQDNFEDGKGVIRSRKSKKDRQHNNQKKKDKRTNSDLQNIAQKNKDRATGTPLKIGVDLRCKQFLLHTWHLSSYSCYKLGDKSWMGSSVYFNDTKILVQRYIFFRSFLNAFQPINTIVLDTQPLSLIVALH